MLAQGKPYGQIADELGVSYNTVVNMSSQLKQKLDARNLPEPDPAGGTIAVGDAGLTRTAEGVAKTSRSALEKYTVTACGRAPTMHRIGVATKGGWGSGSGCAGRMASE